MRNLPTGREIVVNSAQISTTRYVDRGTEVDTPDQNGSILRPFRTIQQGFDALALLPDNAVNLMVFPGGYDEAAPVWTPTDKSLVISNAVGSYFNLANAGYGNQPLISNQMTLPGIVQLNGLELFGGFTCAVGGGGLNVYGCRVWVTAINPLNTSFKDCLLIGIADAPGNGSLQMDGCLLTTSTFRVDTLATVTNCVADGSAVQTFTFAPLAGVLQVDTQYDYYFTTNVGIINNGSKVVLT